MGPISIALAAVEVYAYIFGTDKITDLSHRWPWAILVWIWWGALGIHFVQAAQEDRCSR